jgi:hypothetical protein
VPDINTLGQATTGRRVCWLNDQTPFDDNRANILVARNGRWFGSSGGRVFSDGLDLPGTALVGDMNAARGACGQDGTVGFWIGYPEGGEVQLVAMDATVRSIPDAYPQGQGTFAILDRCTAWWQDGHGQERAVGMPLPVSLPKAKHNRNLFRHDGTVWVAYQSEALSAIVTHPADSLVGYVVAKMTHQEPQFYLMARETAHGVVLCTSWNAEDHPRNGVTLNFNAPRVDLLSLIPVDPPIDPIDPPIDPVDPTVETPVPTPDPRLVQIVNDYWNASGVAAYTAAHFSEHDEAHWKHLHADTLYKSLSLAYYDKGVKTFGVYPKSSGTRYVPFPDKPNEAYAEDIVEIKDAAGVMFYKDIGIGFGGKTPSIQWGEFSRSSDADQHPGAYLPPPKLTAGTVEPPIEPVDPSCQCQAQIDALTKQVAALDKRVAELERRPPSTDINGKRIALMSFHGFYGSVQEDGTIVFDRKEAQGWETFTIAEIK